MDGSPRPRLEGPSPRTPSGRHPGRRLRRLARDTAAVTPLVGTVLILGVSTFGLAVVLTWGLPSMEQTQAKAEIDGVFEQFHSLEEIQQDVMRSGASGKASTGGVSFSQGELTRTQGSVFIVQSHDRLYNIDDTHRYWAHMVDSSDPFVVHVQALDGAPTSDRYVTASTVDPDTEKQVGSVTAFNADGRAEVTVTRDALEGGTLRIRVMHLADDALGEPNDFRIMDAWVMPAGALEYERDTRWGRTGVILEMGSVITDYPSGMHVHTDPLVRQETHSSGETRFLSVFTPVLTGGPGDAPVESTGPGTHPLRFLLDLNMLHVTGRDVVSAGVHVDGPRADLWYDHFEERQGFTLLPDGGPSGAVVESDPSGVGHFEFVVMESRIELTMQQQQTRLDT